MGRQEGGNEKRWWRMYIDGKPELEILSVSR